MYSRPRYPRPRRDLLAALRACDLANLTPSERWVLLDSAEREGLLGLISAAHPELHNDWRPALRAAVLAADETGRAVKMLSQAGLPCAVLKGVAVAALAWDTPHLRPQADVDLLVNRADLGRATAALRQGGVAGETKLDGAHWHHRVLSAATPYFMPIELHDDLSVDLPTIVDTSNLLARRITITTPDGVLPALRHEDAVVYLALHAAVHALERLVWLVDLAGYARRQTVDWRLAAERAREWGVALPVEIAWRHAVELFDAAIPSDALLGLRVSRTRRGISECLLAGADRTSGRGKLLAKRAFRLSLADSPTALLATLRRKLRARAEERMVQK